MHFGPTHRECRQLSSTTNDAFPRLRVPRYTAFGGTRHERSWGESPGSVRSCLDTARCARHSVEREDGHFRSGSPCPAHPECERSEERREGTACVSPCRSRWPPNHSKKTKN